MAKRNEPARRPAKTGEWQIRYASTDAAKGYEELCRQVPDNVATFYDRVLVDPRGVVNASRQHRLKGTHASVRVGADWVEQWQYEITASGRIWYGIGDDTRTVWITRAGTGHPKSTE